MSEILSDAAVTERVDGRHWRVLLRRLHATLRTGSFADGLVLVQRIAALAEQADHHPDVDLRYAVVHVVLVSHDAGGLTERDVALAAQISAVADELGVSATPTASCETRTTCTAAYRRSTSGWWSACSASAAIRCTRTRPSANDPVRNVACRRRSSTRQCRPSTRSVTAASERISLMPATVARASDARTDGSEVVRTCVGARSRRTQERHRAPRALIAREPPSALDGAREAADDAALEQREEDQRRDHRERREREHPGRVHGVLRRERLDAQW